MSSSNTTLAHGVKYYQNEFDPEAYLKQFYPGCDPDKPDHEFPVAVMNALHQLLDSKKCKGKRLLDICSGPTIHSALCGSRYFSEIYLTDYCERNRKALQNWVLHGPSAYDWSSFFRYASYLEGNSMTAADVENRLRASVKGVLSCDLNDDLPLGPHQSTCTPADAILSCLTVDLVFTEDCELADCFKKFYDMLNPGGLFCLLDIGYTTHYYVGGIRYPSRGMSEQLVRESLLKAGFGEMTYKFIDVETNFMGLSDSRNYFIASGLKLQR